MAEKEPTRAELKEQIASLEAALVDVRDERDEWRRARVADDEAEALSACVRALDGLKSRDRNRGPVYARGFDVGGNSFRRLLVYLADRYGVPWWEPPAEDDSPLLSAARAVVSEWDVRGDGAATVSVQNQLREAIGPRV